ncbi:MAG TPA: 16S rRNA (adenine(1518)-N(6)/adenine(1519)-N(6))-dimethyltransferase RsmA [Solirubrobacterales bacterium]|nr:16S rRNA (adenine(1518)-N(6)/adenine(1519)-N(6))-dimethyltransferase RsmA [Solirubrobacterales bacterium]
MSGPERGRRPSLGQNFLGDPNLLEAIVREAELSEDDVVLEVGGGQGVLTERLAGIARLVWVIELDERLRAGLEEIAERLEGVRLVMGDAMKVDFESLDPAPTAMVANLPYAVATPVIMRSMEENGEIGRWTVMVQREIGDRLRAAPRTKAYGAPSVLAQLSCRVEMLRAVDRAVFRPPPRVDSALMRLDRIAPWPGAGVARLVRGAFSHRRKALARSVAMASVASRERTLEALNAIGKAPTARAEELEPQEFLALAKELGVT